MKDLVKNPIGIIALFISLIYGFSNLLLGATATSLTPDERSPLIMFIVLFPVVVLGIFYLLVSRHHGKLYAPAHHQSYTEKSPQLQRNCGKLVSKISLQLRIFQHSVWRTSGRQQSDVVELQCA